MHTNPTIVVDGCDGPEKAVEAAAAYADELLERGIYDSGGPLGALLGGESQVAQSGSPEYTEAVRSALEAERSEVLEYWDILRQVMDRYGRSSEPPDFDARLPVQYRVGVSIMGLDMAGTVVRRETRFGMALWKAGRLYDLLDGRPSPDRFLYDIRKTRTVPAVEERRPDVYAVECDFHS